MKIWLLPLFALFLLPPGAFAQGRPIPRFLFFSNLGLGFAERARTVTTQSEKLNSFGELADPFALVTVDAGLWKPLTRQIQGRLYGSFGAGTDKRTLYPQTPLQFGDGTVEPHDLRDIESHTFFLLGLDGVWMPKAAGAMLPYFFLGTGFYRYSVAYALEVDDQSGYDGQQLGDGSSGSHLGLCFTAGPGYMVPADFGGLFLQFKGRYWSPVRYTRETYGYPLEVTEEQWTFQVEGGMLF